MIKWYLSRLKVMSMQEITYRSIRKLKHRSYEKGKVKEFDDATAKLNFLPLFLEPLEGSKEEILAAADKICLDKLSILGQEINFIGWRKDPFTGNVWHQDFFTRLNYRTSEYPGDIRLVREINRHQFLPVLGVAYNLTQKEKYGKKILEIILSWISDNPRFMGIHWTSSLEKAFRIISWTIAISLMKDTLWLEIFEGKISSSIYEQCAYIDENLSLYSSGNYQLIGELTGLICGCYLLGEDANTEKWLKKSVDLLEKNIKRQFYADGVNKEQAIFYQCYTMEFYFLAQYILQLSGKRLSNEVMNMLQKGCVFLNSVSDRYGRAFHFGDEDGGKVLEILPENWILTLLFWGAMLFEDTSLIKGKNITFSHKLALLYGEKYSTKITEWQQCILPGASTKIFTEGGYWVKKVVGEDFKETIISYDFGHTGLSPLAAHGHSDILTFNLRYKDKDFFIDPGTYQFDQQQIWRNYFKSSAAHNILTINDKNQVENLGPFLWGKEPIIKLYQYSEDSIYAGHYGYKKEGVLVTRQLDFVPRQVKITDTVKRLKQNRHQVSVKIRFHLDHRVEISNVKRNIYKLEHDGTVLFLRILCRRVEDLKVTIETGQTVPVVSGWQSPAFYKLVPTDTLVVETLFENKEDEEIFTFYITTDI